MYVYMCVCVYIYTHTVNFEYYYQDNWVYHEPPNYKKYML